MEVPESVVVAAQRLYARQSRLIDEGDAAGWAATFTADGVFDSPSYPEPSRGAAALTAFARAFHDSCVATRTHLRHVVTNVDVEASERDDEVVAHAYLQIVATPEDQDSRLVRLTTLTDRLARHGDGWLVAHRLVRRDDSAPGPVTTTPDAHDRGATA
ncbi:nuclear transport factor 2 family protein [Nocardioides sp. 1609]|uniref:nuclear transport factor 2 family protein n=1 Tax=Nocardioides sp. 1609 TaxID=2508327 RepID=UPI00106FFEAC|nr:nuclear transport factor 2 family protein [Nocardioides sp. 1609]